MQTNFDFPAGTSHVKIAEGLSEFPRELFSLTESLELLDLTDNHLAFLPDDFHRFKKLRILFLSNNDFEIFPEVLAKCPALSMIGFKANRIVTVPEQSLPLATRWLILTDNRIESLPHSIGTNVYLQKVMLAGNRLRSLPAEMSRCSRIELLRISANELTELPNWLFSLPRLTWLAYAGNPVSQTVAVETLLEEIAWDDLQLHCRLGEGASGIITQVRWSGSVDMALKEFKGCVTSDGLPEDELAATIAAGQHRHLVRVLGKLVNHPDSKSGLLLELVSRDFANLAAPPTLESCTRDVYAPEQTFSLHALLSIAQSIASVALHLHQRGVLHGDLYAHNILVNRASDTLLGDFGAATCYDQHDTQLSFLLQRIEIRAYGCLLEELLQRVSFDSPDAHSTILDALCTLQQRCTHTDLLQRPDFHEINRQLETLMESHMHVIQPIA